MLWGYRQLSGLPELVFPNERDNTYESRDEWNGGEHPYKRIQKSMGQECQPVDTADEKGGPNRRHGGVELGIVFLPDEAHIRNECNGDVTSNSFCGPIVGRKRDLITHTLPIPKTHKQAKETR